MKNALQILPATQMMTSREIADLVESRHDDVKRSIERLSKSGVIQLPPMADVKNTQGQTVAIYKICKRDSYIIVAQLSPQFTAKLVDRWQALESQSLVSSLPNFNNPVEAARAWADQVEKNQEAQVVIKSKDQLLIASNEASIKAGEVMVREFVKANDLIDIGEKLFYQWMRDQNIIMKSREPYQPFVQRGYLHWKPSLEEHGGKIRHQLLITPRGKVWLAAKYMAYLDRDMAA